MPAGVQLVPPCAPLPAFHSGALELRKVKTNAHKLFSLSSVAGSAEAEDMRLKLIGLYHSSAGGRWGSRRVLDTCMHACSLVQACSTGPNEPTADTCSHTVTSLANAHACTGMMHCMMHPYSCASTVLGLRHSLGSA